MPPCASRLGIGHPLVGDELYGSTAPPWVPRIFLHAAQLRVEGLLVELPLPQAPFNSDRTRIRRR